MEWRIIVAGQEAQTVHTAEVGLGNVIVRVPKIWDEDAISSVERLLSQKKQTKQSESKLALRTCAPELRAKTSP